MITAGHMRALRDLVRLETGLHVPDSTDATGASVPRVSLEPAYGRLGDRPLSDDTREVEQDVRVRSVGANEDAALLAAERARDCLSPGLGVRVVPVPGWSTSVRFVRHEMTDVDRDVTLTGTNTHPIYVVETYRVSSERTTT